MFARLWDEEVIEKMLGVSDAPMNIPLTMSLNACQVILIGYGIDSIGHPSGDDVRPALPPLSPSW